MTVNYAAKSTVTKRVAVAFIVGILFGMGIAISGMSDVSKVYAFMNWSGAFDPSLAFVMVGAIVTHMVLFRLITKRKSPLWAPFFQIPARRDLTVQLIIGAAVFGIGWGMSGICVGPALVTTSTGDSDGLLFLGSVAIGMWAYTGVLKVLAHIGDSDKFPEEDTVIDG